MQKYNLIIEKIYYKKEYFISTFYNKIGDI